MLLSERRLPSAEMWKLGLERVSSGLQEVPKPQERYRPGLSFWEAIKISFKTQRLSHHSIAGRRHNDQGNSYRREV